MSISGRIKSFGHAARGIVFLLKSQQNARIHLISAIAVVGMGLWLEVNQFEWCLLIIAIGIVLIAEIFNTAIEYIMDFISPDYNAKVKVIKDLAAGGVLISALTSATIAAVVFIPKLLNLL